MHGCLLPGRTDSPCFQYTNLPNTPITNLSSRITHHRDSKNGKNHTTDKINRPSSELFDRDGFPGNLISILLPQLLHASNEAHLVRLVALDAHAGHLHPYDDLGLHAFDPRELASGQRRLDTRSVPYGGRVLEAHFAGLRQVHHQLRPRFVVFIADDVPGEEAWREVVLTQEIREWLVFAWIRKNVVSIYLCNIVISLHLLSCMHRSNCARVLR
uniref:Uncharacterized protein n=1 Tax=Arundo donax TaxID=35708 RepID=A0A0A9CND1_ARUDO